jgi:hypothetical protein
MAATIAGGGGEEKRRCAAAWGQVDQALFPEARSDLERLVREVRDYLDAERREDPTALRRDRTRRRTKAARLDRAVTALVDGFRGLRAASRFEPNLEPETAMEFQRDAERFQQQWVPFLFRLQGRAQSVARHRERSGLGRNYVLDVVVARLLRIVTTHRRDRDQEKKRALISTDREHGLPYGVLFEVAWAYREALPCLPQGAEALRRAILRAMARLKLEP